MDNAFTAAAHESGVPQDVLLALSYNLTNWRYDPAKADTAGGYGPMGLVDGPSGSSNNAKGSQSDKTAASGDTGSTVAMAATAAGTTASAVRTDPAQNIRAAAILLANDARATPGGALPTDKAGWYPALAKYAHAPSPQGADAFADDVFETLHNGITAKAINGETLTVAPDPSLQPPTTATTRALVHKFANSGEPGPADGTTSADCPTTLDCRFVPAAYDWASSDHSDPNNYGNYDPANRPADGNDIQYIVIHDTESSYDGALQTFESPSEHASANYVIRSSDGKVTQMVPNGDLTWDVANWTMNQHSISIEHEGYAAQGSQWYTPAEYQSSATLVRYLAAKYHIPLDREHIIAHEDVPGETSAAQSTQHWDPGPYWNWQQYFSLLNAPVAEGKENTPKAGDLVTIDPDFASNQPPLNTCDSGGCTALPAQGANFVPLRSKPSADASLINDPLLNPDGSAGSIRADDWTDKAVTGHQYVVAAQQNDWTAIWFDGEEAWFDNPGGHNTRVSAGQVAHVPSGKNSVPLYGRAFPEQSDYPSGIPFQDSFAPTALTSWTFSAGQSYAVIGETQASNYYSRFNDANVADNHTLVTGNDKYLVIDYNHRILYVRSTDVDVSPVG